MFPFSFEWVWDAGHVIFHGALWCVLGTVGAGMAYCLFRATLDTAEGQDDAEH